MYTVEEGHDARTSISRIEWFSPAIKRTKRVNVILPVDYAMSATPCCVLFMLHGYGGNRSTWLQRTQLLEYVRDMRLIVVLPESGRRWFINDHEGNRYEDYLLNEVVPCIEERFNTIPGRHGRAIGGFSMGGAAALFLTLRHPDLFSVVLSHSGAFEAPLRVGDPYEAYRDDPELLMPSIRSHECVWGKPGSDTRRAYDPYELIRNTDRSFSIRVYVDVGLDDYERVVRMNRNVHRALLEYGIAHEYNEFPGGHDWDYVDRALPTSLAFLCRHLPCQSKVAPDLVTGAKNCGKDKIPARKEVQ